MRELPNKEGARLVVAECRTRGALAHQLARLLVGDGAHGEFGDIIAGIRRHRTARYRHEHAHVARARAVAEPRGQRQRVGIVVGARH